MKTYKYKHQVVTCPNCRIEFVNLRNDRLQKFCTRQCASKFTFKNDKYLTYGIESWKMREYRKDTTKCELCGRTETTNSSNGTYNPNHVNKLCQDHNHSTGLFRGLLCSTCNRALGWYENNIDNIRNYLSETSNFEKVVAKVNDRVRE